MYTKKQAIAEGRRVYESKPGVWRKVKGGRFAKRPKWAKKVQGGTTEDFELVDERRASKSQLNEARRQIKEALTYASENLRREGFGARVATAITADRAIDADIKVEAEGDPEIALLSIEEYLSELPGRIYDSPVFVMIATNIEGEIANLAKQKISDEPLSTKELYRVNKGGLSPIWTHPQTVELREGVGGLGAQIRTTRDKVLEGIQSAYGDIVNSFTIRVHWNLAGKKLGRP